MFEVTSDELLRLRLVEGDILVVEGNGSADQIGRNALFKARDEDWIHQNHVIRVRLRQEMALPEFVSGFLNSSAGRVQMLEKARTTSGLYSLSVGKVGELEIPLPSIPEQRILSEALRTRTPIANLARQAAEGEIAAINALPASFLRRAFSGRL